LGLRTRPVPGSRRTARRRSRIVFLYFLACLALLGPALPRIAEAQALSVHETEELVRRTWFEGMPREETARIGPAGARRLLEMLADPAERENDGRILIALGVSAPPGALVAIEAWQAAMPSGGEIDRATFRAWQALPFALGDLALHDSEAIPRLEAFMNADPPAWTFRQHRGARLARLARRGAASALAETGLPEAGRALDRAGRNASDPGFEAHLDAMRALYRQRALERARQATSAGAAGAPADPASGGAR